MSNVNTPSAPTEPEWLQAARRQEAALSKGWRKGRFDGIADHKHTRADDHRHLLLAAYDELMAKK